MLLRLNGDGQEYRGIVDLIIMLTVSKRRKGGCVMKKKKICRKVEIPLAVEAVRDLEDLMIKASRKRKLTAKHRQELLKCAISLRRQREMTNSGRVILRQSLWTKALRVLLYVLSKGKDAKSIFDAVMGN